MIITKTPLRISFCGGGTDFEEFYTKHDYGAVCSMAIDKYVYVSVKSLPDLFPYKYKLAYSKTELCNKVHEIEHPIIKSIATGWELESLDLNTMADIPAGTGMGSSSSFTVGLIHALRALTSSDPTSKELLAICSHNVESELGTIGKQDQYAAAYGGLNYIKFTKNHVEVNPIVLDKQREQQYMKSIRLYYLGIQPRAAEPILREQTKDSKELLIMREQAKWCMEAFTNGTPKDLGELVREGWELKKTLSKQISNPEVDSLVNLALSQGAYGAKLLGAGGSGFLLVIADSNLQLNLGLKEVKIKPDYSGSIAYYLG